MDVCAATKERAEQSNFCFRRRPMIDNPAVGSMERELIEHHSPNLCGDSRFHCNQRERATSAHVTMGLRRPGAFLLR
jgi:hypothetical protein